MKPNFILLLWSILSINTLSAQADFHVISDSLAEEKIYRLAEVEKVPAFPGGHEQLVKYRKKKLKYPALALENHVQGTVMATMVIEKDGRVSNVKIIYGIGSGCDEAVVKWLNKMPQWTPGEREGKPVRTLGTMYVDFQVKM